MKHSYPITGMTCDNCAATVRNLLLKVPGVKSVEVSRNPDLAHIEMEHHIPTSQLQQALKDHPRYTLVESNATQMQMNNEEEDAKSFWETYKPIILVFAFITGVTMLIEVNAGHFDIHRWMRHFMSGFFLVFSFFKFFDLPGFASSYSTYDIIAKRWMGWGYLYPFAELGLGILFLLNVFPLATNIATLVIMGLSSIGVVQSLMQKRRIRCACLGAVFNLPMSTITLVEDLLMVLMSGIAILQIL